MGAHRLPQRMSQAVRSRRPVSDRSPGARVRVVLADDHPAIRAGLRHIFGDVQDHDVRIQDLDLSEKRSTVSRLRDHLDRIALL